MERWKRSVKSKSKTDGGGTCGGAKSADGGGVGVISLVSGVMSGANHLKLSPTLSFIWSRYVPGVKSDV